MDQSNQKRYDTVKRAVIVEYLADRLEREQVLTKYLNSVLNVKYLNLRRLEKRAELLDNMSDVKIRSERTLGIINLFKRFYLDKCKDYGKLSQHAKTSFLIIVDELISVNEERLKILRDFFEDELCTIVELFEKDKETIENKYNESIKDIEDLIVCLEYKINEHVIKEDQNNLKKKESIKFQRQIELNSFRLEIENKLLNLAKEHKSILELYDAQKTSTIANPYELIKKNNKNETLILIDKTKIKQLNNKIEIYRKKMDSISLNYYRIKQFKENINKKIIQYKQFNLNFEIYSKNFKLKLTNLVKSSSSALDKLGKSYVKISKIFQLIKYCRKLEKYECNYTVEPKVNDLSNIDNILQCTIMDLNNQAGFNFIDSNNLILLRNFFNVHSNFSKVVFDLHSLKLANKKLKDEKNFLKEIESKNIV